MEGVIFVLYESQYFGICNLGETITHHGIKGMKWGVRRYQNPDGSLTAEGRARAQGRNRIVRSEGSTKDVEDIIHSMNKKEQDWVLAGSDHYLNLEERSTLAKRVVIKDKNGTPASFFDLLEDGERDIQIALGTRSGSNYRGKGYASKAAKQAIDWVDRNQDKIKQKNLIWGVHVDNTGSIKIAEKNGFKLDKKSYSSDGKWVNYVRPIHTTKRR
jgi:RimJ/RimL family protein N-acetyltransferase